MIETLILWATATFGQIAPPPIVYANNLSLLSWDQVTKDVQGNPETLAGYELAVLPAGKDLNAGAVPIKVLAVGVDDWAGVPITRLAEGFSPGPYTFQVRATDAAGNKSAWSDSLELILDGVAPAMPRGLKITVSVQVTVGQ
jgi:hypothetical protein